MLVLFISSNKAQPCPLRPTTFKPKMNKITAICFLVLTVMIAMCCAYPSTYGYGKDYGNSYGGGYTDYHPPRYGSGYDRYIYGHYDGHQGDYDHYGKMYNNYHGSSKVYKQTPYSYGHAYETY